MKRQTPAHKGVCYIVGAGPGDPGLLTLRGLECLKQADVILYDALCNPQLLSHAKSSARLVDVGKSGKTRSRQDQINHLLVKETSAGHTVCRLKGGDPYVFGRGGEEALALHQAGLNFQVVPGVTSAIAVPAYAGIPVTHRGKSVMFTVITGHEDPDKGNSDVDWSKVAQLEGTRVLLMGLSRLKLITESLIRYGAPKSMPVAVIESGTLGSQRTVTGTLSDITAKVAKAGLKPPAITVLGEVVTLRQELNWFEKSPLFGRRVVVTRTRAQASQVTHYLQRLGAEVIELPTIKIVPPQHPEKLRESIMNIQSFDWLVLTSPNAAEIFLRDFMLIHGDIRKLNGVKIAAVGTATGAKLKEFHLPVDLKPREFSALKLSEIFKAKNIKGKKILLPRSAIAQDLLPKELKKLGAVC
ncbi:MAG: uroporphyrinogen-III C-methyltransferase, partial [Verrucomicrobiota bacterium]|nr:uroporphyrinogen-III C-methyltransferase [Verrucomicrobiota bacterium]